MENIKKLLQNQGENIGYNAKMFFKSHDITQKVQILLLSLPMILGVISLAFNGVKTLDVVSLIVGIFALVYFIYYGRNQELFMEWGEEYLDLYHEIESYYKSNSEYSKAKTIEFNEKISNLNIQKKPAYHMLVKNWVERTIEKEMTYANEIKPWYR